MIDSLDTNDAPAAGLVAGNSMTEQGCAPYMRYAFECYDADGNLKWSEEFRNTVTTVGKNYVADTSFRGGAAVSTWYVGLIDNAGFSAIAAGDTSASHAGWTESTAYSNGTRPTISWSAASSGTLTTSAAASFSINGTATINGAFTISNSTKGGTTGTLYSAGSFGATRSVINGDTLNVSVTLNF